MILLSELDLSQMSGRKEDLNLTEWTAAPDEIEETEKHRTTYLDYLERLNLLLSAQRAAVGEAPESDVVEDDRPSLVDEDWDVLRESGRETEIAAAQLFGQERVMEIQRAAFEGELA